MSVYGCISVYVKVGSIELQDGGDREGKSAQRMGVVKMESVTVNFNNSQVKLFHQRPRLPGSSRGIVFDS